MLSRAVSIVLGFNLFLIAVCAYSIWRGGAPEQITGIACLLAAAATLLIHMPQARYFRELEVEIALVDLLLLGVLVGVALRANRYWPIWAAAAHSTAVAVHVVRAFNPTMDWPVYAMAASGSSIVVMAILAAATVRHRRRLRLRGSDPPWRVTLRE